MSQKTVIVVAGPTAVGKTAAAIRLAQSLQTEIISADSRQCFREMKIGVARPSEEELTAVPHHFIASHAVSEEINAAGFAVYALEKAEQIFQRRDQLLLVGGTGLYIRAFCEGLDEIPQVPAEIRQLIIARFEENGLSALQEELRIQDPAFYQSGEIMNPQRVMRALEVKLATGRSILDFRSGKKQERPFRILRIGLELPREELTARINARTDQMMSQGWLEEVKSLLPWRSANALQTVGYTELFDYLDGKISLEEAIERIRISTRQYAKRQMTWFRKEPEMKWFAPDQAEEIGQWVRANL